MAPKHTPRKRPAAADAGARVAPRSNCRCVSESRLCAHACLHAHTAIERNALALLREASAPRPGRPGADPQALCRRAIAAGKDAAARLSGPAGFSIVCECTGQPRREAELSPLFSECVQNPELWQLPPCASRIRLAFTWKLVEQGETIPAFAGSCVVRLDNAVRQGVPIPVEFAQPIAARISADAEHSGASPAGHVLTPC